MGFETEYKKEMNKISPSEEQFARICEGVERKISKKKKPLYLKIAAASSAAVVIIGVGAAIALTRVGSFDMEMANGGNTGNMNTALSPSANGGLSGGAAFDADAADGSFGYFESDTMPEASDPRNESTDKVTSPSSAASGTSDKNITEANRHIVAELDGDRAAIYPEGKRREYEFWDYLEEFDEEMTPAVTEDGLEIFVYFDENLLVILFPDDERFHRFTAVN